MLLLKKKKSQKKAKKTHPTSPQLTTSQASAGCKVSDNCLRLRQGGGGHFPVRFGLQERLLGWVLLVLKSHRAGH